MTGRFVLSFVIVASSGFMAGFYALSSTYREASLEACRLVKDNYYKANDPAVSAVLAFCVEDAKNQQLILAKSANIKRINARLAAIGSSHLAVYDPDENRSMWENLAVDTGIRARFVEDQIVVHRVLPGSPAELAQIHVGDSLKALNNVELSAPAIAESAGGVYTIRRGKNEIRISVRPEQISEDRAPTLSDLGGGRGLLRISSFLSQYFETDHWEKIAKQALRFRSLVIDLRDNSGGSFPAMLRALSPFRCRDPFVGRIFSTAKGKRTTDSAAESELRDSLDSQSQMEQLSSAASIRLKVFNRFGCFDGPVVALVDSGTSSVSEIFAQAILTRPRSDVLGTPTAGQVVMARWFSLPSLGSENYQIAIPIAGYMTPSGFELESNGVHPRAYLEYELPAALAGRDSWIEAALNRIRKLETVPK